MLSSNLKISIGIWKVPKPLMCKIRVFKVHWVPRLSVTTDSWGVACSVWMWCPSCLFVFFLVLLRAGGTELEISTEKYGSVEPFTASSGGYPRQLGIFSMTLGRPRVNYFLGIPIEALQFIWTLNWNLLFYCCFSPLSFHFASSLLVPPTYKHDWLRQVN